MPFNPNNIHGLVDGTLKKVVGDINRAIRDPAPTFVRMVILDVCSDPQTISDAKAEYWVNFLGVTNPQFARILPRNSVIAQRVATGETDLSPPMFLFPFFPSHLALPCKPGEMVWAMFENPNARIKELGFWFCKITEPNFAEDVNHSHPARQLDQDFNPGIVQQLQNSTPVYDLINGKPNSATDGTRFTTGTSQIISSEDDEVFESLVLQSDAATLTQYESVPRFRKRPADIAIEGSNNTLIVLGTDRVDAAAYYEYESNSSNPPIAPSTDMIGFAGSIDMVAGRGMNNSTGGTPVDTTKISDKQPIKKELGKHAKVLSTAEGNPDFFYDRSRVLISQRTMTDRNFGLAAYMTQQLVSDTEEEGDAAIVIKSDKVRIIARSDISLIVTDFTNVEESEGISAHKEESTEFNTWASMTIKSNGDIIFTPSEKGYIKLGGDDADQAILCTERPATASEGTVSALPIATTAGGFVGVKGGSNIDLNAVSKKTKPDFGSFSTKVLIK